MQTLLSPVQDALLIPYHKTYSTIAAMDSTFLGAEHHFSSTYSSDNSQAFHTTDVISMAPSYGLYDEGQGYHGLPVPGMDDNVDMANRARLTTEQLAELEREFAVNHKPNTDHKKMLADRMRVEYSKVNVSNDRFNHHLSY